MEKFGNSKCLILLLLLGLTSSQMLSPGRITHPMASWTNNPIELSENNMSKTGVSVTFTFAATTALTAGEVYITFPTGFTVGAATISAVSNVTNSVVRGSSINIVSGDNTITVANVDLPTSAGGYGPFKIVTRASHNGQIMDANYVFGSVGIAGTAGVISNFTVAYESSSTGTINLTSQKMRFTFTIANDLWKHDMFVIHFDNAFTVASSVTCKAYATSNEIIYYNSTGGTHTLDCKETAQTTTSLSNLDPVKTSQALYIYGNANDIFVTGTAGTGNTPTHNGAANVKLEISGITNPYAKVTSQTWSVQTQRFQTKTIIDQSTAQPTLPTILAGAIASSSYASSWGTAATDLTVGAIVFMDIQFSTGNPTYDGNMATIVSTDNVAGAIPVQGSAQATTCWVTTANATTLGTYTSCTSTANTITVSNLKANGANASLTVRVLATLNTSSANPCTLQSIKTQSGSGLTIDETTSGLASFTRGSHSNETISGTNQKWGIGKIDTTDKATVSLVAGGDTAATDSNVEALKIAFKTTLEFKDTTVVTIKLPLSTTAASNDKFFVPSDLVQIWIHGDVTDFDDCLDMSQAAADDMSVTNLSGSVTGATSGLGNITVTYAAGYAGTLAGANWYVGVSVNQSAAGGASKIAKNPLVMSNQSTKYEIQIKTANVGAAADKTQMTFIQPVVAARIFEAATAVYSPVICDGAYNGQIVQVKADITETPVPTTTYHFQLAFPVAAAGNSVDALLDSGLSSGDNYPVQLTKPTSGNLQVLDGDNSNVFLRIPSDGQATDGSNLVDFFIALPDDNGTANDGSAVPVFFSVFTLDSNDARYIPQEIYYESETTTIQDAAAAAYTTLEAATGTTNIENYTSGASVKVKLQSNANFANADYYNYVLPTGTQIGTNTVVTSTGGDTYDAATTIRLSSANRLYKYPSLAAAITHDGGGGSKSNALDVTISNLTTRDAVYGADTADYQRPVMGGNPGAQCVGVSLAFDWVVQGKINGATKKFTSTSVTPKDVTTRSFNNQSVDISVKFTTSAPIPDNGEIEMNLENGEWEFTSNTVCTVAALGNNADNTPPVNSNPVTGRTFTINGFGAVAVNTAIDIQCTYVLTTNSAGPTTTLVDTLVSRDGTAGKTINDWDKAASTVAVNVSANSSVKGVSSEWTFDVVPDNKGLTAGTQVDLHLKFKVAHALPKGSVIDINVPNSIGVVQHTQDQLKDLAYSKTSYAALTAASGTRWQMTLMENVNALAQIELYIVQGVTVSDQANPTGFYFSASWQSQLIIEDSTSVFNSAQKFTPANAMASTITPATTDAFTMDVNNAGEYADYTFKFKTGTGYAVDESIVITFPTVFDPYVGHAQKWLNNESTTYYLECSSTVLGLTWCSVDKWTVTIMGSAAIEAANDIDVTLHYVKNPAVGTTTQKLRLGLVGSDNVYKALSLDFAGAGVTTTAAPSATVSIADVHSSDHHLFGTNVTYTFKFYVGATTFEADENVSVMFPMDFDLNLVDGNAEYTCDTQLVDNTGTTEDWNDDNSCSVDGNWVELGAKAYTLESTDRFTLEVQGVGNPESAMTRTAMTAWDFDATDVDVNGTLYGAWSGKFCIGTYDLSAKGWTNMSYDNLNAAYVGYDYARDQLLVNNGNRITVYAGSYSSDVAIVGSTNDGAMQSKSVKLTPSNNPRARNNPGENIKFQSLVHDFLFLSGYNAIHFRVGAALNLAKGIYYIDWSITEEEWDANQGKQYHQPAKTMVEVIAKTNNKYAITVEGFGNGNVYKGTTSPSIGLSITNSPFDDMTVALSLLGGTNENITFKPASLTFGSEDRTKYFAIEISSDYDLTTANPQTIVFTPSGTDADIYSAPTNLSFQVNDAASDQTAATITQWGAQACAATSCELRPTVDQVGTLWWAISAKKSGVVNESSTWECPALSTITANTAEPNATEEEKTDAQKENDDKTSSDYLASGENEQGADETWEEYQYRLYRAHLQDSWYGALNIYNTSASYSINATWLFSATEYQICGYAQNVYNTAGTVAYTTFATTATDANYKWTIQVTGSTTSSIEEGKVNEKVAYAQGVNPSRNMGLSKTYTAPTTRRLQNDHVYTYEGVLVADRSKAIPTTASLATLDSGSQATLTTELNTVFGVNFNIGTYTPAAYSVSNASPSWTTAPSVASKTESSVTFSLQSSDAAGRVACVILNEKSQTEYETNNNYKPSQEQVSLGVDVNNQNGVSYCAALNDGTNLTCTGLAAGNKYSAFCTATSGYLLWPSYVSYNSLDAFDPLNFTTNGTADTDDEDDDSALLVSSNIVALCTMIAALIFN